MKKVLSVLLAVCMIFSVMSALTVQAENKVEIIMDEAGVVEAVGTIASTGGIGTGWKEATHDGFYGGTAMRAAFTNTNYTYTFQPKVDAGWYDVYTYYGWTLVEDGPTAWGAGTWTLDNGLGAEGNKAKVSVNVNDGLAKSNYAMEDGWYKLGTVYFGGTHTKDIVSFKQTANRPHVDAIKIVTSDYDPDTIIMEQDCTNEALGKVTSSGGIGVGWTVTNNTAFSGGTAYHSVNDSNYHVTFWPKVDAGWYDVYTYYGWTETVSAWGAGTWKLDNGLGETGKKAAVSTWVNDGLAKANYAMEDGWYKLGTVYFSGEYEKDYVKFTRGADMPYVDAIKIKTSDYDPDTTIMEQDCTDETLGKVTSTGGIGVGWTVTNNEAFSGGSAYRSVNDSNYKVSFLPKVDAGWYDVYTYYGWTLVEGGPTAWGSGNWTMDNGLGETTSAKAPISVKVNDGLAKANYAMEDGWYKLGTVYFSGVYEKDSVTFTRTADMPYVDAVKITKSDYEPAPEPEPDPEPELDPNTIIMDESGVDESIGKVTNTGAVGVGWNTVSNSNYYGGSALQHANFENQYTYTFMPKLSEGWYDVYIYKNWTCWGSGIWSIDNGLNETGAKAPISQSMNLGKGEETYPTQDGWYKLGTAFFSGVFEKDTVTFTKTANMPVVDAIKIVKVDYDPNTLIMDEAGVDASRGSVAKSGSWDVATHENYYGGTALRAKADAGAALSYYPKVEAGWYDVYMYKNWTGWGTGNWTLDNGLGQEGVKAPVTAYMNIGWGEDHYPTVDGWYKLSTFYFSGVFEKDRISFVKQDNAYVVDAVKIVKSDFDTSKFIMSENAAEVEASRGSVTRSGNWSNVTSDQAHNGSIARMLNGNTGYITFYPKAEAGWYKISTYNQKKGWGTGKWTIDNGLNESGIKSAVSGSINCGQALNPVEDGWYTMATVYFSGVYKQDYVKLEAVANAFEVDAIKVEAVTPNFDTIVLDENVYLHGGDRAYGSMDRVGTWSTVENENAYNGSYSLTGEKGDEKHTFYPRVDGEGFYSISVYNAVQIPKGTTEWEITNGTEADTMKGTINQGSKNYQLQDGWLHLATMYLSGNYKTDAIAFTALAEDQSIMDAVKIEKVPFYELTEVKVNGETLANGGTVPRSTTEFTMVFDSAVTKLPVSGEIKLVAEEKTLQTDCIVNADGSINVRLKDTPAYGTTYTMVAADENFILGSRTIKIGSKTEDAAGTDIVEVANAEIADGVLLVSGNVKTKSLVGISGRTVTLIDENGNSIETKTSGKDGAFTFYYSIPDSVNGAEYTFALESEYAPKENVFTVISANQGSQNALVEAFMSAEDAEAMKAFLETYAEVLGITVPELFYEDALYASLLSIEATDYQQLTAEIKKIIAYETENPVARLYNGDKEITKLESGNLKIVVNSDRTGYLTAVAAIYNGGQLIKSASVNTAEDDTLVLGAITVEANTTCKLFFWETLDSLKPVNFLAPTILYVATDDKADGETVLTLSDALAQVDALNDTMTSDIVLSFAPGTYAIDETITLGTAHSGKNGHNVVFKGAEDGKTVFSGAKSVEWSGNEDGIWYAEGIEETDVRQLYVNGKKAERARTNTMAINSINTESATVKVKGRIPSYNAGMELVIECEWRSMRIPVTAVNTNTRTITCDSAALKDAMTAGWEGAIPREDTECYLENALDLIDEGKFVFITDDNMLYYMARSGENFDANEAIYPATEGLMRAEGTSGKDRIEGLVIDGIHFQYGANNTASRYGHVVNQADMTESRDMMDSQLIVNNAKDVTIQNCTFSDLGSGAIMMTQGVENVYIINNDIRNISGSGIIISHPSHQKYGNKTAVEYCKNIVVNDNVISNVGQEYFASTGILAYYPQNMRICHNTIENIPYSGISLGWGWGNDAAGCFGNEISYNHISNVMTVLRDGGYIYLLGDMPDTKVYSNYLKGPYGPDDCRGIYLDDGTRNLRIYHNVIENTEATNPWITVNDTSSIVFANYVMNDYITDQGLEYANPTATTVVANGNWAGAAKTITEEAGAR